MFNTDNVRLVTVKGLKEHLDIPVVRSNQTGKMPEGVHITYTITTIATENHGTYGEYADGKARKPVKQIWSITAHSNDYAEAVSYANRARSWLDYEGTLYLDENGVIVESVGSIGDRSNILTVDYQYTYGFDVTFWGYDEIDIPDNGAIEKITLGEMQPIEVQDYEAIINDLQTQLDKANAKIQNYELLILSLENRLKGGD